MDEPCCREEFFPSSLLIMPGKNLSSLQIAITVILTTGTSLLVQTGRTKHLFIVFSLLSPNEVHLSPGNRQEENTQPNKEKNSQRETQHIPT